MTTLIENKIRLNRTYAAPRSKVFAAWTDEKTLVKWFAPSDDYSVELDGLNARLGGRYRIILRESDGTEHVVTGVFEEFEKNDLLGLTWSWEGDEYFGSNRVTVCFADKNGSTELILAHGFFPDKVLVEKHESSWNVILNRLTKVL